MIRHGEPPYLECSTRGDRRLSAFCARIRGRRNQSIETLYQAAKLFEDGTTGLGWREAKGRKPVNMDETRALYSLLWDEYVTENPDLLDLIRSVSGLADYFGNPGSCCQATELWRIRNAAASTRSVGSPLGLAKPVEPHLPRILNKRTDRIPPDAYYCGRPGPLGNPFVIGRDGTRDQVVDKFAAWVATQPKLMAIIATLEGRDLICWCAPLRCHCEPVRRLANPRLFAEAVGTPSTAGQAGAGGRKLYRHVLTVKEEADGWWICEDGTPLEGPFVSQDRAYNAIESC